MTTEERIRQRLAVLAPEVVEVVDESAFHVGHEGAKSGGGHYRLTVISPRFAGKSAMARHRMIYDALRDLMQKDIHALSIRALSPDEF
ncbi:BolA family protein [Pelomicrobium methylotrophicum]|uniref:BolA family transcriptional regulator n=1 Tax=Pelomicrobium methylotrophicum TaxID=2602750 RepID=A0A5C7EIN0_9PROT|nr:BolA family protein [Pelomicrobium methylotrophicum]TXF10754.1 BolA family transcriptional regulator [Pelomicrobium methylotrophicum]